MEILKNIPSEIDYNEFKWLRRGDREKIAAKTGMAVSTVRHTLKKRSFNADILAAAMDLVIQTKKKVLERQIESKRLTSAMNGN